MHFHKQLGEAELHKTCSGARCCMLEIFIGIICSIRRLHTNWKQLYMCRHCANTMTASDREHHIIYKQRNYQSLSTPMAMYRGQSHHHVSPRRGRGTHYPGLALKSQGEPRLAPPRARCCLLSGLLTTTTGHLQLCTQWLLTLPSSALCRKP